MGQGLFPVEHEILSGVKKQKFNKHPASTGAREALDQTQQTDFWRGDEGNLCNLLIISTMTPQNV